MKLKRITQKLLFLCFTVCILLGMPVLAATETIAVEATDFFSAANPSKTMTLRLVDPLRLENEFILNSGVEITGDVVDVVSSKRMKRNAKFSFIPVSYKDASGNSVHFQSNIKATYSKPLNKAKIAKNAAIGVGGLFVKGLSMGVAAVEGAIENEDGNRLKSCAHSIYEASPVSYIKKGQELNINPSDVFYLKFKY